MIEKGINIKSINLYASPITGSIKFEKKTHNNA